MWDNGFNTVCNNYYEVHKVVGTLEYIYKTEWYLSSWFNNIKFPRTEYDNIIQSFS